MHLIVYCRPFNLKTTNANEGNRLKTSKLAWAAKTGLLCVPMVVLAQEPPASNNMVLEEVVVTGTPGGGELRKLDASFAITNVDDEDIRRFSPKSTADLLKTIPGVWAESSGGVAGANVFVRGFPGTGDAPFLTVQLEGAPVYPPATLSFLENTTLFRIDETVERMEGLRGGPQSVQDNGQPGLTTNFLLKRGGENTEGTVKYSTSDYDLQRFDAVMSGPLGDGLYYMVGGYVTSSPGIRDAGFSAEKGNQFTVKLTKELDNGIISVYHRNTDDHGTWYLPSALNAPQADDNEYTQVGTLNRKGTLRFGPDAETRSVDLSDGRGWDGSVSGLTFDLEISAHWSLSDSLNYTNGAADTVGLVPDGGAVNVGGLLANPGLDEGAVVAGPLTGSVTGRAINSAEFIQRFGLWEVRKEIESFTNNLALTGSYDKLDLTLGSYTATASVDDLWSIGNADFYVVEQGGERIDGIACSTTADGCGFNFDLDADGDVTSTAFYAVAAYRLIDTLALDIGVRQETYEADYSFDADRDGTINGVARYDENETSYTVGANLDLSDNQGVFTRYSQGYKFPNFDELRENIDIVNGGADLIQEIKQLELGYKLGLDNASVYVTLFGNQTDGSSSVARPGAPVEVQSFEAVGVEIDAQWFHESGFALNVNATIQATEITDSPTDPEFEGNEAQRQPPWQVRLSPSYDVEFGNGMFATLYGAFTAVDDRFADNGNAVTLDGYEKLDLGVIFNASDSLSIQLAADNVTDEDALTEGDPRNPASPNGRFILPRSYKVSVGYSF